MLKGLKTRKDLKELIISGAVAVIAMVDESTKGFEETLELVMAKEINREPKVQFLIQRLKDDLDIKDGLEIYPKLVDKKCTIEGYALLSNGEVIVAKDNLEDLMKYCTELLLSGTTKVRESFVKAIEKANKN